MPTPPPHSAAWQARRDLARRLSELRERARLTRRALAVACGWHESKTSRIESAKTAPSADDLRAWADVCGVPHETGELVAALESIEGMWLEWRRVERGGLRRAQETAVPLWERTRRFRAYSSWLIPGAVQTPDYVRAVLGSLAERRNIPGDLDDAVRVRVDKLRVLQEAGRQFAVLIEESALRTIIGGNEVMAGQLGHLLTVGALPTVALGIIPMSIDRTTYWPVEDFWIFDDDQVNVELISGHLTITPPREVAMYADAFARLTELAVYGTEARRLIVTAIEALR